MRRSAVRAASLAAILCLFAFAQTPPDGVQKVTSVEGITEFAYTNGLRVLLFPDPAKPAVTVNITYLVGSRHEGYGETGMAHLLEHMLFLKTTNRADIKTELTGFTTDMNGTTDWDRTNYFETMNATPENLRRALALEADRMVNVRLEKSILDTEMTVVRNEFEMGENNPQRILTQRAIEAAYSWHNYGHLPIGNRSDIENVPVDRLAAFYKKYYQPDNALLVVAGRFDETQTLAWIAELFGRIPKPQRKLEQTYTAEPQQDGERLVTLRRVGEVQGLVALYHIPAAGHPDSEAIDVLAGVLGDAPSGRLYKALVEGRKAVGVGVGSASMHDPGFFLARAQVRQEQSLDDARDTMLKVIEGAAATPPTKEEVERVKTRLLKEIDLAMTDTQAIALALSESAAAGDWRLLFLSRDRLRTVTEQDVARAAKTYLKASNRTLAQFIPTKEPDRAPIDPRPDLVTLFKDYKGGEAISQGEAFEATPAKVESRVVRSRLAGGMKLALVPKKTRGGIVTAQLTLHFGDEKSLFGKSAAADVAGDMLMRGTKNRSRQQIEDEIDRLKAQIEVSGGLASASASIQTTEANLSGALRLAAEMLREPSFPENEFEQLRQANIAASERSRPEPQSLAPLEAQRHLWQYPRGDARYVSTPDEDIEDMKALTLDGVKSFHKQFYGASTAELAVVGQFDPAVVQKLVAELFESWKSPAPFQRVLSSYRKVDPISRTIETPDKQNAVLFAGTRVKISDEDADYPAMVMANYMLGRMPLANRLFRRIRDKEGLSYSVSSSLSVPAKDDGGAFFAQAISAPQNTPKAEASLMDELARTAKEGFTAGELAAAKSAWSQDRLVQRSQDGTLAAVLANREFFDRTMKFDEQLEAKVAALTPEQVSAAFRRLIDPASLTIVRAGDFKKEGVYQK